MTTQPSILFIYPGPTHDIEDAFGTLTKSWSEYYGGAVITTAPKPRRLSLNRFEVACFPEYVRIPGPLRTCLLVFLAIKFATNFTRKQGRFDLIVTYDPLRSGLTALLISFLTGAKVICEVNGDYTSDVLYSHIRTPYKRRMKKRLVLAVERFVLSRVDGIKHLFPSQLDFFKPSIRGARLLQHPDFVDLAPFRDLGETEEVLFVGHPLHVKGVDILIAAFKRIAPEFPNWRLTILGWFPDLTEMNSLIAGHPQISHHPPVYHREIAQHIGQCGILCLPSRTEAMGRVLLEAMACGKPRVASRVGGTHTVIDDQVDGFLFESENVDQLAGILKRLMADPELRKRVGAAAARRAEQEFARENYFQAMRGLFDAVLGPRG